MRYPKTRRAKCSSACSKRNCILERGVEIKAIVNGKIIIGKRIIESKTLYFDRSVLAVDRADAYRTDEVIDAKGLFVAPGFIDMHIHGCGGADVMDATPEALHTISDTLVETGTTLFAATTMTMPLSRIEAALENIRQVAPELRGARCVGAHLEGPFISPDRCGAQDKRFIRDFDIDLIDSYADIVKVVTFAPEKKGGEAFLRHLRAHYPHIVASIGHSDATYEEALRSFANGVSHVTHLFNAMPAYHHRAPGIVGAVFEDESATADIIADTIHTHGHHLNLAYTMLGERLILITDVMRAGCMRYGRYDLGGQMVKVGANGARLQDGTLAGSILRMNEALRHMCTHSAMTIPQAVYAASTAPARKLGLRTKGRLETGYDADIILFDENFDIITTIISGRIVYTKE